MCSTITPIPNCGTRLPRSPIANMDGEGLPMEITPLPSRPTHSDSRIKPPGYRADLLRVGLVCEAGSDERNRPASLTRAFAASTSRYRGGAFVTRESSSLCAALATRSPARSKAIWFALESRVEPLGLRTNCSDDALISSSVAAGLKLWSVLIFRHMQSSPISSGVNR